MFRKTISESKSSSVRPPVAVPPPRTVFASARTWATVWPLRASAWACVNGTPESESLLSGELSVVGLLEVDDDVADGVIL